MNDGATILLAEDREDDIILVRKAFEKGRILNPLFDVSKLEKGLSVRWRPWMGATAYLVKPSAYDGYPKLVQALREFDFGQCVSKSLLGKCPPVLVRPWVVMSEWKDEERSSNASCCRRR